MEPQRIRATDVERNRVLNLLSQAFSNGQLDYDEFDTRTREVTEAKFRDELLVPLEDLLPRPELALTSAPHMGELETLSDRSLASLRQVTPGADGNRFSLALMSGTELKGRWTIAPNHTAISLMGGTQIDLTSAAFAGSNITIHAYAIMGGIDIIVPEDVHVQAPGFALMGGFGVSDDRSVTMSLDELPVDAPTIRVTGMALMGGVQVTRKARPTGRQV